MRDIMLNLHFLGLVFAMGALFAYTFIGKTTSNLTGTALQEVIVKSKKVLVFGDIGLTLIIISGGYLGTPYWPIMANLPTFMVKLLGVVVLAVFMVLVRINNSKAIKTQDADKYIKSLRLSPLALFAGFAIIILAVFSFH